jgi:ABC-type transport system involved in multi-copper enzyme maturation permease subunit
MSKAITEKHDDQGGKHWEPAVETAPSVVRADEPTVARTIGLVGASLAIFGLMAWLINPERIGYGRSIFVLALGIIGMLSHAVYDRELQIRRIYWVIGLLLLAGGVFLCLVPWDGPVGVLFFQGFPCLALALFFLLATLHHETDPLIRHWTRVVIGGAGGLGAAITFLAGNNLKDVEFLVPYGALLGLLSLAYLAAFVSQLGLASDVGYNVARGIGLLGLLAIVVGLLRSLSPSSWEALTMPAVPWGVLYISLGLLYVVVSVGMWSDNTIIVLTRRELSSYFFSPLIYLVLIGLTVVGWFFYQSFIGRALDPDPEEPLFEPILRLYVLNIGPILMVSFLVPILTMKLLSEERRTGALEVLLTAPVNEFTVVVGKFLAAFILFMIMWCPWWLFLIALRVGGGEPFDYRPLFSFQIALAVTGASFVSMGLFCSSLTQNQVASAVLSFAGMILFLGITFLRGQVLPSSSWSAVLRHADYINLWLQALDGVLVPRFLLFHLSSAVIWLFLSVKVLEARRWA